MDTTTVSSVIGIDPASPFGQLIYPVLVSILATLAQVFRKWMSDNPLVRDWVMRIAALLAGMFTKSVIQGQGVSLSAIVEGSVLGLGAIGGWEILLRPILQGIGVAKPRAVIDVPPGPVP